MRTTLSRTGEGETYESKKHRLCRVTPLLTRREAGREVLLVCDTVKISYTGTEETVIPITEFRTMAVGSPEPDDRTAQGTVIGTGDALDLGTVDTTDEAQNTPVRVIWWRVSDMNGAVEVRNIRVWLERTGETGGNIAPHMDVTDAWTQGKTPVQVETGTPGDAPSSEGAPNVTRMGGGEITGITHDQTTQYIYISGNIGVNVPTGTGAGARIVVKYDFR